MGFLAVIGSLLVLILPETKGQEIPDTVEEMLKISSEKKKNSTAWLRNLIKSLNLIQFSIDMNSDLGVDFWLIRALDTKSKIFDYYDQFNESWSEYPIDEDHLRNNFPPFYWAQWDLIWKMKQKRTNVDDVLKTSWYESLDLFKSHDALKCI